MIFSVLGQNQAALQKFQVKRLGLFGSFASGKQRPDSDLDFVVELEKPSFDNFMDLADFLEKLFGRKVDLLTPAGLADIRIKSVANEIKNEVVYG